MEIATFTSGKYTQIGYNSKNQQIVKTIESKILFQDPDEFVKRFLSLIKILFSVKKLNQNDRLIFAVGGIIDEEKKQIIESDILNDISFSKYFNGFNYVSAFGEMVGHNNIYLINDSNCVAYAAFTDTKIKTSANALSLFIDDNLGVSIIKEKSIINYNTVLRPIESLGNKTGSYILTDRGIDDILLEREENIYSQYTDNLIVVLKDIIARSIDDGFNFNKVFIHSMRCELIVREQVKSKFPNLKFSFTNGTDQNKYLPIKGALRLLIALKKNKSKMRKDFSNKDILKIVAAQFLALTPFGLLVLPLLIPLYFKLYNKINKLEYFNSKGKKITSIDNFSNFVTHWRKTKPIAPEDTYYIIFYNDNSRMKIFLESLNSITDLFRYNFFEKS